MSDFRATERIIGGLVVVGVASLLSWNVSQDGDPGLVGTVLIGVMVAGALSASIGLFDLLIGRRWRRHEVPAPLTESNRSG